MSAKPKEKVAILGASDNPERYAYKAYKMLQEYGHSTFPVHPSLEKVENTQVTHQILELKKENIDTLTLYVNPRILESYVEQIIELKPRRVIFNPGTESFAIEQKFENAGIKTIEGCTLVMLRTNQF
ncbi:CoA-binding protein [Bdellovibrio sp. HCB337]|uniref:CoA-binding protein n=1 Tax=Bdellovibrio sp. HCB337 TaxID=3394358 RepID=UPI0039A4BB6B